MDIIKVAANSRTASVAGSIAHAIRENGHTQTQGIGRAPSTRWSKRPLWQKDT